MPLDQNRLQVDRNGDGIYEESWMPESTIAGRGAGDGNPPVTSASLEDDPRREGPLLTLEARDRGSSDGSAPPSGIGITYYWINHSGPRIYAEPMPVETGDVITYWSIDRAGNVEWRRTTDVRQRAPLFRASAQNTPSRQPS